MTRAFAILTVFALAALASVGVQTEAGDERATKVIEGPFDLRRVRRVSFALTCDDVGQVRRSYLYFKSGAGSYVVPFRAAKAGCREIVVDRSDCIREEGRVAGWGKVSSVTVSFWHDRGNPPKWSVSDFRPRNEPYEVVVITANRCVHGVSRQLSSVGLHPLLLGADEVDDAILAPAQMIVPIGGKTPYPEVAQRAIAAFKARGGGVFTLEDRLTAKKHPERLPELVERRQPSLAAVLAADRPRRERIAAENARAAAEFPAFMRAGGEDEIRAVDCHIAYGPERVVHPEDWEDWNANCAYLKGLGFNALCVNVCRGGIAFYRSDVLPEAPEVATKGDSVDLIRKACGRHGLKFIAWKVCFRSREGMKTPAFEKWIAEGRSATTIDGKADDEWLCPVDPRNRRLEVEAFVELAKRRPWAVSLDYIRYPDDSRCFCDRCRAAFEAEIGRTVAKWPRSVRSDPELRAKWQVFRRGTITSLVREIAKRVRAEAPGVKIRASVFRYPRGDALTVAQDWSAWCREGLVDVIAPMDGAADTDELRRMLALQKPAAGDRVLTPSYYPSTHEDPDFGARELMDQIGVGRAAGLPGFGVFTFDNRLIRMLTPGKEKPE